jgi:hypothetical protein
MAESKKALMIRRTAEYLALHSDDPAAYPATVKDVAAFVPVSRRLFYKADPEIHQLVADIEAADAANAAGPVLALTSEGDGLRHLSADDLERDIEQTVRKAVWAMRRWVGIAERSESVAEAPMLAAYLEEALREGQRVRAQLDPLIAELQRRRRDSDLPTVHPPAQPALL